MNSKQNSGKQYDTKIEMPPLAKERPIDWEGSDSSNGSRSSSVISLVKGDIKFTKKAPKGKKALEALAGQSTLLTQLNESEEEHEVVSCCGVLKKDRWSQLQLLFLFSCIIPGTWLSVTQFIKAYDYTHADMKPKKIDETWTYFVPGSADYEQPYYYFMFRASNLTNETWPMINESYGWVMDMLGFNIHADDFLIMDQYKALILAELYFRFPHYNELVNKSQVEQRENNFDVKNLSRKRLMYFSCGHWDAGAVVHGPNDYRVWAEKSQKEGQWMVLIQLKFDDFAGTDVAYQPHCKFDIYTNDTFNIREEVNMNVLFFPSFADMSENRGDEILRYIWPVETTSSNLTQSSNGGGRSWESFGEKQNKAAYIVLVDDNVLHEYGQLVYYRMTETRTDGAKSITDKTETYRHATSDFIRLIVFFYPSVEEWETYYAYGWTDAISSLGSNYTLITLIFFTVTRMFAVRDKKKYGVLPYLKKEDLLYLKVENMIELASIHDYNLRCLQAGIAELNESRKSMGQEVKLSKLPRCGLKVSI